MTSQSLISFIKDEREKNVNDSDIKTRLLSNGWKEADIAEAFKHLDSTNEPNTHIDKDLEKFKDKVLKATFLSLVVADIILILIIKLIWDSYGFFGIGIGSVVIRLLVLFGIASYSTKGIKKEEKMSTVIWRTIGRTIASVFIALAIIIGLFFAFCFFIFSGF
jgi:uncharacterized membrane protein YdbT with pleckstrin-like domain